MKFTIVTTLLCAMLSACTTVPNEPDIALEASTELLPMLNSSLFTPVSVISEAEVSYLTDQQKQAFFAFVDDPKFSLTPRHQRVATYIGLILDQFTFSDQTLTTQKSLATSSGNCLSLTLLTTAYAKLAGVAVTYQLLDQNPIFSINSNNLLVTSDHLRAVLVGDIVPLGRNEDNSFSSVSRIRIDYFDTDGFSYVDNISTDVQLSLFYSNLAVEQLSASDLDSAYSYAQRSLEIHKGNASALNTMAILHRKRGDLATAESIYFHGAKYFDKAPVFVRGYTALLENQSREVDLSRLIRNTSDNSRDHPWQLVRAGKKAYNNGEYDEAVSYYQRALALSPDLHQLYFFVGLASYAAGNRSESEQYLAKALNLSKDNSERNNYKRKLQTFKR